MTDRDRLIELICDKIQDGHCIGYCNHPPCNQCKDLADYLIANGVIVPPCKVGTKVWILRKDRVPDDDYRMSFHNEWVICEVNFQLSMIDQIGKTVFLTPEEAKKALESYKENT